MTEDVLFSVRSYIESGIDAQLVAIEATRSCSIPRLEEVDIAEIASRQRPILEILPENGSPDYAGDESPRARVAYNRERILLVVTHAGSDPKEVSLVLLRYGEALEKLIEADSTCGGRVTKCRIGERDYSFMVQSQEDKRLEQSLFLRVEVKERR